jgi:hypothetical protein
VLTLSCDDPVLGLWMPELSELPLVYGFVFDECRLKYRVVGDREIEMLHMKPKRITDDWPYPNYPAFFPEKRLGLRSDGAIEPDRVEELTWQGLESIDPAIDALVIVPQSRGYGVSLWGEDGGAEDVQVIFEIDVAARTVAAANQCG